MELGKVLEVELTSSTQTTWLIQSLYNPIGGGTKTDTVILKNIYTVWKGKPKGHFPGDIGYGVSLLLQNGYYGDKESIKTPITFTSLKKKGLGKVIHVNEKTTHFILAPVVEKIKAMEDLEQRGDEIIIPFDKPIVLNAQGSWNRDWGVTSRYYFVGMKVWRYV